MANDTVHELAEELLEAAATALACEGIDPPGFQYVGHGVIPWDCELLAVAVDPALFAPLDIGRSTCQVQPKVTLQLTILRCWPTQDELGRPPTAAELTAAAEALNADLWVLQRHLARHTADGSLFSQVTCQSIRLGAVTTLSPQGGFGGWQFAVLVTPHDTDPLCGS